MKFNAITWPLPKATLSVISLVIFLVCIWALAIKFCRTHLPQEFIMFTILISLLACVLTWWYVRNWLDRNMLEQKVNERTEELRKSDERLRSFVENINDVLFALTPSGLFSYVSPQWTTAFGYASDETLGQHFQSFVHPDDIPKCLKFLQRLMETGKKQDGIEYRVRCKNGTSIWYMANASLLKDPLTEALSLVGIGRDITLLKLADDAVRTLAIEVEAQADELRQSNASLEERVCERTLELAKERERLSGIIKGTNVGTWEWNVQTGETVFNERWAGMIGYRLEEIFPLSIATWRRFVHQDDLISSDEAVEKHFCGETDFYECELRMQHNNGNWVWVLSRGKVITWNEEGKPLLMMGTHRDITESKRLSEITAIRLRLLEFSISHSLPDLLRATLDEAEALTGSRIGFYHFLEPDQTNLSLQAWSTNTVLYMCKTEPASGSHYPLDKAGVWVDCVRQRRAVIHNDYESLPYRKGLPEGHAAVIRELVVPVIRGDLIVALLGVGNKTHDYDQMDIEALTTLGDIVWEMIENKRSAEDLLKSKDRISQLLQSTDQGIYGIDLNGCCTFINNSGLNTLGYQLEDCLGKNMHDLIHHTNSNGSPYLVEDCPIFRAKSAGVGCRMDCELLWRRDGTSFQAEYSSYPIIENGKICGAVVTFFDITESKKLKEQLLQSQKMEAVGQLAGGLAHDLNNALSVINGYCCLMQMEVEHDKKLNEYLEKILTASEQAGELTHSMLAFSRTQVMKSQNQNLNVIVSKVGAFVENIIGDNIKLTIIIKEAKLPVNVDGGQIEQVLINLVNNARDAMPEIGELSISTDKIIMDAPFISLNGFGQAGQYAVITVSDTGTGMDNATKSKIFEPFFTTKAVDKGTGLGLSMVYGIIKQHKGFVDVVSTPGHGASFRVFLPIVEAEAVGIEVKKAGVAQTYSGTETIMIAEDNSDLLMFMDTVLSKLGYQTILAGDGQEAVDKFRDNSEKIQLIIMDMIMPNKSGKTAYDEIKQIKPNAMALFSSGYSAKIIKDQGELGEYAEFITKPIKPATLLRKVREMLDRPLM